MNSHDVMLSWTAEGDKRLQDACASGSKLQLTHMALGNASTPLSITDLKQAQEVRNVIYQAPLECVTVDREKNSVIGELILPENKKEEAIREIGVFELDTLVAVGYSSSPYRPVRQEGGALVQMVRLPLNTIPASAIETVSNVINFRESDTSYLHAAENLKDVLDKVQARLNLELGTAATRNVGTNSSELITTGDADNRYLKGSENLLSTKAELSKLTKFFNLFVGDPDVLTYLL
ncbi:phage tail protein [Candidatus Fukatsuia endosymbiont of Tuberolachnus salignus]|uniref:phage tail protein n=1 Tax=Candidatus Fukatsuia endosymbiont of Tuberolachnus salignus TaxID=3077957 RepID=UPI00313F26E6